MKINHLIIGCMDRIKSLNFYCEVLGFENMGTFVDTGTKQEGSILVCNDLEFLLVPFVSARMPSPQHLALEVSDEMFSSIYQKAKDLELSIRAMPSLNSTETGTSKTEVRKKVYERFYLLDPSNVNLEVMRICQT